MCSFQDKIKDYCGRITQNNFSKMYSGLIDITIKFNNEGVSKELIVSDLNYILNNMELDQYQDEVISEVLNRITGYTYPALKIDLREW